MFVFCFSVENILKTTGKMYRYQQTTLSSMVKLAIATDQSSKVATRKIPVMFVAVQQNRQKSSCIQSGQVLNVASVTKQHYNEKHFEVKTFVH